MLGCTARLGYRWVATVLYSGAAGLSWAGLVGWEATTALGCFHSPNHGENMEFGK